MCGRNNAATNGIILMSRRPSRRRCCCSAARGRSSPRIIANSAAVGTSATGPAPAAGGCPSAVGAESLVVGQFETSGARVVPTRSISSQFSRCGLRTIRAPVKLSHYRMQRILDIMPVRTGLTDKLKAQPFQGAADFIAGKIARQFHAGWRDKTGSSTKCRRMGQCRHSSSASNRHWIKSRIIAINSSRFSPCVAISGSWQMATSASSSRSI